MELHKALRHIIQAEGAQIVNDLRLVNILTDLCAFDNIQGSKYIMRAIIADGISQQFLSIGELNNKAVSLINKFSYNTGFNESSVRQIFNSIAFGLLWINDIPIEESTSALNNSQNNSMYAHWTNDMTDDETDRYFQSMTSIDCANEYLFGVKIQNLHYFINSYENLSLSCEVYRVNKGKKYVFLNYAVYDTKGRVIRTGYVTGAAPETPNPYPIVESLQYRPEQISKIRLFWN